MKVFLTRTIPFLIVQESFIAAILLVSFALRYDLSLRLLPPDEWILRSILLACVLKGTVLFFSHLHRIWRTPATAGDTVRLASINLFATCVFILGTVLGQHHLLPLSVYALDFLFSLMLSAGVRFAIPIYEEIMRRGYRNDGERRKTVLIYGAGQAGLTLLREYRSNPKLGLVVGFLDDDRSKRGAHLMGTKVLGTGRQAAQILDRLRQHGHTVDQVIIAMPSATGRQMQEALANCRAAGIVCQTIPGLGELLRCKFFSDQIRSISLADLLGRQPVELDEQRIREDIKDKSVMITGAAGSIGSELCRQIARHAPSRLIAFDQSESDMFRLEMELRSDFPSLALHAIIGDIRNHQSVDEAINTHSIDSIFHAGAYKHVPLMESHSLEALHNNVLGTWNVVSCAMRRGVGSFLMISSDKAVNPANIMGTTKRAAELIVSAMQQSPLNRGTKFVSVRFGNVLGSNGSVVPVFQKQIAAGGPVTVTHPEIRRYFMTIPEAVQLVLQASTMGKGGEIFVLDMGEPVKIADLARNMIRLTGRVPDEEIEIRFVGLRPGEKLYEELISGGENIQPTFHRKIKIFKGPGVGPEVIEEWLRAAALIVNSRDKAAVTPHLKKLVPEYITQEVRDAAAAEPESVTEYATHQI